MATVEMYTKKWCPHCIRAKALLDAKGVSHREIDVTSDAERQQEMVARSRRRTVPQRLQPGPAQSTAPEQRRVFDLGRALLPGPGSGHAGLAHGRAGNLTQPYAPNITRG